MADDARPAEVGCPRGGQRGQVVEVEAVRLEHQGQELALLHRDGHVLRARLDARRESVGGRSGRMEVPEAGVPAFPVVLPDHRDLLLGIDAPRLEMLGESARHHALERAALGVVGLGTARHLEEQGVEPTRRLQEPLALG